MKTMNKRIAMGAAAAAVVLVGGLAFAQGRAQSGPSEKDLTRARQHATWKVDDALDGIRADARQREVVHAVKDELFTAGFALRGPKETLREELVAQWRSPNPDANTAHAAVDRMLDQVRGFAHLAVDAGLKVHQVLRPEQREQLYQKLEERRSRWHR
jgi:protein CpxP